MALHSVAARWCRFVNERLTPSQILSSNQGSGLHFREQSIPCAGDVQGGLKKKANAWGMVDKILCVRSHRIGALDEVLRLSPPAALRLAGSARMLSPPRPP